MKRESERERLIIKSSKSYVSTTDSHKDERTTQSLRVHTALFVILF